MGELEILFSPYKTVWVLILKKLILHIHEKCATFIGLSKVNNHTHTARCFICTIKSYTCMHNISLAGNVDWCLVTHTFTQMCIRDRFKKI